MEIENNKTKSKLDQLRLVMQQRRERREARKMRSAPYGGRIDIGAASATATASAATSAAANAADASVSIQVDGPAIVEQINIA